MKGLRGTEYYMVRAQEGWEGQPGIRYHIPSRMKRASTQSVVWHRAFKRGKTEVCMEGIT